MPDRVNVVGAGLAGCEAAWRLAQTGVPVRLYEMKPQRRSPAHQMDTFAELVCSNSLKASRTHSAAGLLKEEMRRFGSLLLEVAALCEVPAGGALAVDRGPFSQMATDAICGHENIEVVREELDDFPDGPVIVCSGPLTSAALSEAIKRRCGTDTLSFYDAAAPIVEAGSIDMSVAFRAARYGRGGDDYLNCPMDKPQYERFHAELVAAETVPLRAFEDLKVYEGCMPVEVMAGRGVESLRFGPLKPVGLTDPRTGHRPWAVVQLRRENAAGTLWGLVGFQTNLRWPEQKRVFSMIPGLEAAEFARFGVMHRNTFLDAPRLLDERWALRSEPRIRFAGQITGVEGYMESAASGILAAEQLLRERRGDEPLRLPPETMLGALSAYVCDESVQNFQPMGANMGLLPPLEEHIRDKQERYKAVAARALSWYDEYPVACMPGPVWSGNIQSMKGR